MLIDALDSGSSNRAGQSACPFLFSRTVTHDADEQAENLRRWDQTYEQLTAGRFRGSLTEAWLDGLQVFREITNQSVREGGRAWSGSRTFGVPLAMSGSAVYCGKPMHQDMLLTLNGDEELDFRTPRLLDIVGIAVPTERLSSFARTVEGRDVDRMLRGRHLIPIEPERMARTRELLRGLFEMCETTPHLLDHPHSRRTLEHSLLSEILAALSGAGEEPSDAPSYATRRQLVDRARAHVLSHLDGPVTVADLCAVLGVSRRTLQYCFQDVLDTKPVQYLRAVRLSGARRDLKAGDPTRETVQDIAARWGFWYLSHFAADYRRMFGELPSETLERPATDPS